MALPSSFVEKYGPYALVTGASSGIGEEYARQLAAAGLNLVITARRENLLENLSKDLKQKHDNLDVRVIVADLTESSDVTKIIEQTSDVDVGLLINNAGVGTFGSFFKETAEWHEQLVKVNVMAPMALAHAFGQRLAKRKKGGIIFVSSITSRPFPFSSSYSGSKAFISTLALVLAHELAPHGVDVMSMEPGVVETAMSRPVIERTENISTGMPVMSTERAVKATLPKLGKRNLFIPGLRNRIMVLLVGLMPRRLQNAITGSQFGKLLKPDEKLVV